MTKRFREEYKLSASQARELKKWPMEEFPLTVRVFQVPVRVSAKTRKGECSGPFSKAVLKASKSSPQPLQLNDVASLNYKDHYVWLVDASVWLYEERAYVTEDRALTSDDVRALINVAKNKRRLTLEKAHALQSMNDQLEAPNKRQRIPQSVKVSVWQRDRGRCVECESQEKLEFDHVIVCDQIFVGRMSINIEPLERLNMSHVCTRRM